jgi:hypothetical protein
MIQLLKFRVVSIIFSETNLWMFTSVFTFPRIFKTKFKIMRNKKDKLLCEYRHFVVLSFLQLLEIVNTHLKNIHIFV